MSARFKKEIFWLLLPVCLTMVAMLIVSWRSGWDLIPGITFDFYLHDTYIIIGYGDISLFVFAHLAMLFYTLRNFLEKLQRIWLNAVTIIVYGYVAYIHYTIAGLLHWGILGFPFYCIMALALLLAIITITMLIYRLRKKN